MLPIHLIVQKELLRDKVLDLPYDKVTQFSSEDYWLKNLKAKEYELMGECRPLVIASIEACEAIRKHLPFFRKGVVTNYTACHVTSFMAHVPHDMRLNETYFALPFGEIAQREQQLRQMYGEELFIRPNDSRKSFSGFSCHIDRLAFELSALRQTQSVHPDELCILDRKREFKRTEYRTWLIDGKVATLAPYSHYGKTHKPPPQTVLDTAQRLAEHMEMVENAIVADFAVMPDGQAKLIELNAVSTSGVYEMADLGAIIEAFDELLV